MASAKSGKPTVEFIELEITDSESNVVRTYERDAAPPESSMNMTKWLACLALGMSYTTAIQQQASTASIVKHIDAALGPTTYYNWMLSGHNITVSLILPLAGGLSDIFGRKYFFIVGCFFSLSGVSLALAAKDIPMMIAAMVLKGIGSGAQQLSLPAIAEIVPNKHRGTAQAVLDLVTLPWTVFGAMIGNSMVKHYALSFRINFIIGILLNLLTIVLIWFFYHPPPGRLPPGKSVKRAVLDLDWFGIFLLACSIVLTLVGIALGGSVHPWLSVGVILPLTMGVLSIVSLGVWESKFAKDPFFSPELFQGKDNQFGLLLVLTFVGGMSLYSAAAFFTQQMQGMFFSDPDKIGLTSLPSGIGGAIGGFSSAMLLGKGRAFKARNLLLYGGTLKMVADVMFTTVTPKTLGIAIGASFLAMFGIGSLILAIVVCVQLSCMDKHMGLATLIMGSVRSMGGSMAVTIYSSIMQNTLKKDAEPRIARAIAGSDVPRESLEGLVKAVLGSRPQDALKLKGVDSNVVHLAEVASTYSYGIAFQRIYFCSIAFTAMAISLCFFIKDVSHHMTNNVAVTLENDVKKKDHENGKI